MTFSNLARPIQTRISFCGEGLEAWKADHELAKSVYRLEDQLENHVHAYDELRRLQRAYRQVIKNDASQYDEAFDRVLITVWHDWLRTAIELERERLVPLEGQFETITNAADFRERLSTARNDEKYDFSKSAVEEARELIDEVCNSIGFKNR